MAAPGAGDLDRTISFLRGALDDDVFAEVLVFSPFGDPVRAKKSEASDGEAWRAAQVSSSISARFIVHRTQTTLEIGPRDRIICEGVTYEITGRRELQAAPRRFFEFSVTTDFKVAP